MAGYVHYVDTDYQYALNPVAQKYGGGTELWMLGRPGFPHKHFYPRSPKAPGEGPAEPGGDGLEGGGHPRRTPGDAVRVGGDEHRIRRTGEMPRGEAERITGLKERSARMVLSSLVEDGILGSQTPKGPVSLRFPSHAVDILFPRLFDEG
jgi:hypothetical protein